LNGGFGDNGNLRNGYGSIAYTNSNGTNLDNDTSIIVLDIRLVLIILEGEKERWILL
jgi:hypothetical protein